MGKLIFYICIFFILANCSNKTTYSGKILDTDKLQDINFKSKEILISKLGFPSYIDPIQNKYFYFSEKSEKKSILKKEVKYSYVFVFTLDKNDEGPDHIMSADPEEMLQMVSGIRDVEKMIGNPVNGPIPEEQDILQYRREN